MPLADKLATPAVREHLVSLGLGVSQDIVCCHCFHSFVYNAASRNLAPGSDFGCSYSDTSSLACDKCRNSKAVCEQVGSVPFGSGLEATSLRKTNRLQVPMGMSGDRAYVCDQMGAYQDLLESRNGILPGPWGATMWYSIVALVEAFHRAMMAHRSAYNLSGSKKSTVVSGNNSAC